MYYVSEGVLVEGKLSINRELKAVEDERFQQIVKFLDKHLLRIDYTRTSSYDNSDDDRVEDSYSSTSSYVFRKINPVAQAKYLLMIDNEIKGVVFYVNEGRSDERRYGFLFDGSVSQTFSIGYSASHSSTWTYVDKVSLKKIKDNKEEREAVFSQSGMYIHL